MIEEINPDHKVTCLLHDQWHKILAAVMIKFNMREVVITAADVAKLGEQFPEGMPCILAHDRKDGLHISVISEAEARRKGVQ